MDSSLEPTGNSSTTEPIFQMNGENHIPTDSDSMNVENGTGRAISEALAKSEFDICDFHLVSFNPLFIIIFRGVNSAKGSRFY